jgi:small subunit ribosomal protein S18
MPPTPRPRRKGGPAAGGPAKRRGCHLCREKIDQLDYKNIGLLRRFVSERGKIRPRRVTGACRRHQNQVATAVRRAREMALLPYVAE